MSVVHALEVELPSLSGALLTVRVHQPVGDVLTDGVSAEGAECQDTRTGNREEFLAGEAVTHAGTP